MISLFWDNKNGGFFLYGEDSERLVARPKEIYDGALPSGNSVAALNMLRLARLTGDNKLETIGLEQVCTFGKIVKNNPSVYTYFLMAAMFILYPGREVVFAGNIEDQNMQKMIKTLQSKFLPHTISLVYSQVNEGRELEELVPFIHDYKPVDGRAAAYVCENFTCQAPFTELYEFEKALNIK